MNYKKAVNYLLEQLPMFQRIGASAYRNDLTNITRLCSMLNNPQNNLKCIHIAGTNGKGSVTHIIASILQEEGYKVGVFVSPHYKDFRERIKINGKYIRKKFVTDFVDRNIAQFKNVDASFFEISTVMAFEYFKQQKVDYAIIETGMGGRLDSTNIINPLLSVITNISYDHQQFLGDTLPKIAAEKAGIIKRNVPVVIGETQKETSNVFLNKAKEYSSAIYFADKKIRKQEFKTDLNGNYQQKNIRTALMAIKALQQLSIKVSEQAIKSGLKHVIDNTAITGRWMVVSKKPLIIFDSAHNEGGLKELITGIGEYKYDTLHIVYGTVGDKDISKNLGQLPTKAIYYFCNANLPRALNAEDLKQQAKKYKLEGIAYHSVREALKAAKHRAKKKDLILVCGSVFVVAEVIE